MSLKHSGFTLIELLVVIAIIGILASVVLASISDARQSSQDAAIKQAVGNFALQAEQYYNENGFSYIGLPPSSDTGIVWAGTNISGTARTCDNLSNGSSYGDVDPYGSNFLELCRSILSNMPEGNSAYFGIGYREGENSSSLTWRNGEAYAIYVRLNSGNWYCVNSFGIAQEGTLAQAVDGCRDVVTGSVSAPTPITPPVVGPK